MEAGPFLLAYLLAQRFKSYVLQEFRITSSLTKSIYFGCYSALFTLYKTLKTWHENEWNQNSMYGEKKKMCIQFNGQSVLFAITEEHFN